MNSREVRKLLPRLEAGFNVYALEGAGSATKLNKYRLNVSGVVVDGTGYGTVTSKKPALQWPITVKTRR